MSDLTPMHFDFDGRDVRIQMIDEQPWWVLVDVCKILGIEHHRDVIRRLESDEYNTVDLTHGIPGRGRGNPFSHIVNEKGLYNVIFASKKPEAKRFRNWVFGEVLPSIRKTGRYEVEPQEPKRIEPSIEERIGLIERAMAVAERFDLVDDATRLIAREAVQNLIREGLRGEQVQPQIAERSTVSDYFQVEDLRSDVMERVRIKWDEWVQLRSHFGKIIRLAIQAVDQEAKPIHFVKMVNGKEREVNGWPLDYRAIAVEAIVRYLERRQAS